MAHCAKAQREGVDGRRAGRGEANSGSGTHTGRVGGDVAGEQVVVSRERNREGVRRLLKLSLGVLNDRKGSAQA